MNYFIKLFITIVLVIPSFAIMPPKYYKEQIENSQIKANAKIIKVKILHTSKYKITKEVTFELLDSFGNTKPPKVFKGWCLSAGITPLKGGDRFFYPKEEEKVYVTILESIPSTRGLNGRITSLQAIQKQNRK